MQRKIALANKISKALKIAGDAFSVKDLEKAIWEKEMQLWQNDRAVVITELRAFPQYNIINIVLAAGDLDAVMAFQPAIEDFGRANGASRMVMMGREGWSAVLPKYGWKRDPRVIYEKEL